MFLHIELTESELQYLLQKAEQHGYPSPEAYIKSLLLTPTEAVEDIRVKLKRAFRDALHDDVLTEDEFWQAVADDELLHLTR
jgi:hypothetical protein